jgi:hypothetical protein
MGKRLALLGMRIDPNESRDLERFTKLFRNQRYGCKFVATDGCSKRSPLDGHTSG